MRPPMQCSIDAVRGDEATDEAARLIRHWRGFRDRPDCAEARVAEAEAVAWLGEHFPDEPVVDFTGLVVLVNPMEPTSLWCFHPTDV